MNTDTSSISSLQQATALKNAGKWVPFAALPQVQLGLLQLARIHAIHDPLKGSTTIKSTPAARIYSNPIYCCLTS